MGKIICVWGDSIAWGAYDTEAGGWVERLKTYLWNDAHYGSVYNLSIDGDDTGGVLKRFEQEASVRKPNTIIFAIGINDLQYQPRDKTHDTELTAFEENIQKLATKARIYTKKIVFVGLTHVLETKTQPIPWSKSGKCYVNKDIEIYNEAIQLLCKKEKIVFIRTTDIITKNDLDEDGVHLNSQGHKKLFEEVRMILQ